MHLRILLPQVKPSSLELPEKCPHEECGSRYVRRYQVVNKKIRDTVEDEVVAWRCQCVVCKRTFRVYPEGVDRSQTSLRVRGLAVMLYLLGLSYGAVSLALEALGIYQSKTQVYEAVQEAARRVPGLRRRAVYGGIETPAVGADLTSVKCKGKWLPLGLAVDDTNGTTLTVDLLPGEDAETLREWLGPVLEATGAQLLVTDDADSFKQVADAHDLDHQICKSHVKRNTEALVEDLKNKAQGSGDPSLREIGVSDEEAQEHLERLRELVKRRDPEEVDELAKLYDRYTGSSPPKKGERASLAYRMYLLFLDRWNMWARLTRYRSWQGPNGESVDGTNNGCERAIGWDIKERYRTMRGYKNPENAVWVSRLLAWCGNNHRQGGADLSQLLA
jgi:transposase-like protein